MRFFINQKRNNHIDNNMRGLLMTGILLLGALSGAPDAQAAVDLRPAKGMKVDGYSMERSGEFLVVDLGLDLEKLKVNSNRAKLITPRLINGSDSVDLQSLGLYGRRRFIYYERNFPNHMISGPGERVFRRSQAPDTVGYHVVLPYAEWMNGARLTLTTEEFGCCRSLVAMQVDTLGQFIHYVFAPEWVFVRPKEEGPKSRSLSGQAFVDFPVDQTVIYPSYRRNATELGKIQGTIDSVRNDKDVTVKRVWLKGFASPESPYAHNTELSLGRVAALKKHIQNLYNFPAGTIETDNEPEDWAGLRKYVSESNLLHRSEILALIDKDMNPDAKEARIKKLYPEEYKFMLAQYYPALRHTDYRIDYVVRDYTDIDEIRRIYRESPSKLSLNELFTLANSYPEGSAEFNDVFETAARMYPGNETANLNAATAEMEKGNYQQAGAYLKKAGDTPTAIYARGVLAALREDYAAARKLLEQAEKAGIPQAKDALGQLDRMKK